VNVDLSIHRMAFREADSLILAQVLVAKKRADLELRELRQQVLGGAESAKSNLDSSLKSMEDASEAVRAAAEDRAQSQAQLDQAVEQHVDKTV
jgi:hypothetical protein